jgi:acetyl esterase
MIERFDVHPDMAELISAKQVVARSAGTAAGRAAWDSYGESLRRPYPEEMAVRDTIFTGGGIGDRDLSVRIYRPKSADARSPCVLYLHGGAFIKGSLDSGDTIAWGVADQVGAVVVSLDYRLAPEHPFPAALEDCHAGLSHVAAHADELDIDPARIAVWGDSAGGNLAAALSLLARDRGGPALAAAALNYPCLTDVAVGGTYETYATSPGWTTAETDSSWTLYLGRQRPTDNPYAAPLKSKDLTRLPPTHIHIAEIDPLADDGRRYAERLAAAGSPVELRCAERMIHGFLRARFSGPDAAAEFARPCAFLRRHLQSTPGNATLRRGVEADVPAIRDLTRAAYAKWVPLIGREPKPMTADYEEAVRKHRFDLLYVEGTLAALIETIPQTDHLLIENLAVSPRLQGRGLGRKLMAHAEKVAASLELREIRLYTNKRFAENVRFYGKLGYRLDGEEEFTGGIVVYMSKSI